MKKGLVIIMALSIALSLFGCTKNNDISKVTPLENALKDFSMSDVELLDDYTQNAFSLEMNYLKSLDADKLLKGFCEIGGVESDAEKYEGWETSAIQGHTLGHYLTAVSQGYATSGDESLKTISDGIIAVLAECQNKENGYLAAIPESHYFKIEKGDTSGTWVPWYSMHKTLAGLISCYELTGNKQALEVASRLGDWVYSHTSGWSEETQKTVLNIEYGGMNDCLYQLYKNTGDEKHLSAAHSFDELTLFDALYKGEDVLNGKHANTTIPKIIGALNRYTVTGEEYYLQTAVNFWEIVIKHHTYITGGNSEWEHFGEADVLDAERTNCTCETCNTYNMLKLTRELYKITGESKYADYYENTFINAILSSQNSETGMTTYFQPMATGFFKVYSSTDQHFWCCTGSGMENFSKLDDSIYYKTEDSIFVTQFTSSSVLWKEKDLKITQKADLPQVKFTVEGSQKAKIILRVPDWCVDKPTVKINGEEIKVKINQGQICLDYDWKNGDEIEYILPMQIEVHTLPDNENAVAFKYGPWVLSADMGKKDMNTTTTGVNVTIPLLDSDLSDVLVIEKGTIKSWLKNINENLVKQDDGLEFVLKGTNQELVFSPHYKQHESRYGIYFILADSKTKVKENAGDKYTVIDVFPVANDQYEFSHNLKAYNSNTGNFKGLMFRDAEPNGQFSYEMTVESGVVNFLAVKYYSGDAGRCFTILIDDELLADVRLEDANPNGFYDVYYEIPSVLIEGKEKITVTFKSKADSYAGGIFDKLSIVKEK